MSESRSRPAAQALDVNVVFAQSRFTRPAVEPSAPCLRAATAPLNTWLPRWFSARQRTDLAVALHNLSRSLRGRHDWRGHALKRLASATKYLFRAACVAQMHTRFLGFLHAEPVMRAYIQRDPRVFERHFHRYVNLNWNRRQRLQAIHEHYRFALRHLPAPLFAEIYAHGRANLGVLSLKDGSTLRVSLQAPIRMGSEGELCISLNDVRNHPLYRIVFSVIDGQTTLAIGCLQGPVGENARDMVRELTRNMHGMRPKQLMLSLVYAFARHYGIERVQAVANAAHPLRRRGRKFHADYDAFWLEQHGSIDGEGWFDLPASPIRKTEADVPSHHRSAFRRREALRVEAEQIVIDALGTSAVSHAVPITRETDAARLVAPLIQKDVSWIS